ncbi:pseudouridine synthase, partial [Rhizobium straminoryzae]
RPAPAALRAAAPAAEATDATAGKPERISKILARAGVASRRDVERMIMDGRVRLNGQVLDTPVVNATLSDRIEVDGEPIRGIERTRLWLYHKPAGLVTTNSDPEGRPTVFDNLPEDLPRVMSIGRLDINTEGLLLLTNDGGLSRVLELPTTGWLRRYRVRAHGEVTQEALDKLKEGIAVDGVLYGAIDATLDRQQGHNVWITMGLREGKNREIKNVLGALGLDVNRLIRVSYGPFQLGDLPEGHVVEVRGRMLRDQLGPRLIEESKANFEAPVYSNPVADDEKPQPKGPSAGRDDKPWGAEERREGRGDRDGDRFGGKPSPKGKGPAKGKDFDKRGGKFGGDGFGEDKPKKRLPLGTARTANVWMAPGARPTADGGAKKSARAEAERLFSKGGEAPRRASSVNVNRVEGDSDWIRAEAPARRPRDEDEGGFGRRDRGDRADRGDRPERGERRDRGDRPDRGPRPDRAERSDRFERGERSSDRSERSFSDRPRGDRKPREDGDRPRSKPYGSGAGPGRSARENAERAFSRPEGGRPEGRRAEGERGGFGSKPAGGKPFGGKPSGGKPGAKPFGSKPSFGGKPVGGKPSFGSKPGGGKPGGGKPGGRPAGGRGPGSGPKGGSRSRTPRG